MALVRLASPRTRAYTLFFVRRSIIAGAKNNIFGMVGFVREGRKSQNRFDERLDGEAEIKKIAAAKKAAKAKAAAGKQ